MCQYIKRKKNKILFGIISANWAKYQELPSMINDKKDSTVQHANYTDVKSKGQTNSILQFSLGQN